MNGTAHTVMLIIAMSQLAIVASGQSVSQDSGIRWSTGLNWQEVKAKAARDKKYIFLDCYTTWCAPCRQMDKTVYPLQSIGDFMNANFICVRVQMDTSKTDDEQVKRWYADAHDLLEAYVNAFPTYLYFDPSGKVVHKGVGLQTPKEFTQTSRASLDTAQQYFARLTQFEEQKLQGESLLALATTATLLGESTIAEKVARFAITNYLNMLPADKFIVKNNLAFVGEHLGLLHSNDDIYKYYLRFETQIDSVLQQPGAAKGVASKVIDREIIKPAVQLAIEKKSSPNWSGISHRVTKKYGKQLGDFTVLLAQINWYSNKNLKTYCRYLVQFVDQHYLPSITSTRASEPQGSSELHKDQWVSINLNNYAWTIFNHSAEQTELQRALHWIDMAISNLPAPEFAMMDTRANLLYKLGKKQEALQLQQQAVEMVYELERKDGKEKGTYAKNVEQTLERMRQGVPTWDLK